MADFRQAILLTLQHEGGYVDNPNDPGGATKYGIEQRDLPSIPISTITEEQAVSYYSAHYWKPLYGSITSQKIANKLFDMGVLFGIGMAVKDLQIALGIQPDGIFGIGSLAATNAQTVAGEDGLLSKFKSNLIGRVFEVIEANPKEAEFKDGWINRINS